MKNHQNVVLLIEGNVETRGLKDDKIIKNDKDYVLESEDESSSESLSEWEGDVQTAGLKDDKNVRNDKNYVLEYEYNKKNDEYTYSDESDDEANFDQEIKKRNSGLSLLKKKDYNSFNSSYDVDSSEKYIKRCDVINNVEYKNVYGQEKEIVDDVEQVKDIDAVNDKECGLSLILEDEELVLVDDCNCEMESSELVDDDNWVVLYNIL